jgi:hypothetical protein
MPAKRLAKAETPDMLNARVVLNNANGSSFQHFLKSKINVSGQSTLHKRDGRVDGKETLTCLDKGIVQMAQLKRNQNLVSLYGRREWIKPTGIRSMEEDGKYNQPNAMPVQFVQKYFSGEWNGSSIFIIHGT